MACARNRKGIALSLEAAVALAGLLSVLALVPITGNARQPAYGRLLECQLLEDVMETVLRKPELLSNGELEQIGEELGACIEISGHEYGCSCNGIPKVSTARILPEENGFRRVGASLCWKNR